MKRIFISYIILIIAVCIGGEFQFYSLYDGVRISFGTPVFFFFLLWSKRINPVIAGPLVGVSVVIFRTLLLFISGEQYTLLESFLNYANTASYYTVFGVLFYFLKTRSYYHSPFIIALIGIILENFSFLASVSSRYFYLGESFTIQTLFTAFIVSILRSFFVLGFYKFFLLLETNAKETIYKQKNEEFMIQTSNLYVEMVQLRKLMKNTEDATRMCYELHRNLFQENNPSAKDALLIAGEVHEMKKDHQRIYSGLTNLQVNKMATDFLTIDEILDIAIKANRKYAKFLNKSINFEKDLSGEHPKYHSFVLLSIINNLLSNSIEAIEKRGKIAIFVKKYENEVNIQIQDNGSGISSDKLKLVFEPGFTTKYDSLGNSSTGIGLPHIKEVIEDLDGKIQLFSNQEARITIFTITLPTTTITEGIRT